MIIVWILLICWGLWLLMPYIGKWLMRMLQKRMQKQMFRGMGIDPSMFEGGTQQTRKTKREDEEHAYRRKSTASPGKIIPDGYGEYVKFTVMAISGNEPWLDTSTSPIFVKYSETQVTDVRWVETNS